MKLRLMGALLAYGIAMAGHAATIVTGSFSHLGGQTWQADMSIAYDGPSGLNELTLYFPEHSFADLVATSAPASWNTLTIQRDLALPAPGFIDYLFDAPLALGSSTDFSVQFSFLDSGTPQALRYEGYDARFNLLLAGQTAPAVSAIPEPGQWLLLSAGLAMLVLLRHRTRRDTDKVAA